MTFHLLGQDQFASEMKFLYIMVEDFKKMRRRNIRLQNFHINFTDVDQNCIVNFFRYFWLIIKLCWHHQCKQNATSFQGKEVQAGMKGFRNILLVKFREISFNIYLGTKDYLNREHCLNNKRINRSSQAQPIDIIEQELQLSLWIVGLFWELSYYVWERAKWELFV